MHVRVNRTRALGGVLNCRACVASTTRGFGEALGAQVHARCFALEEGEEPRLLAISD